MDVNSFTDFVIVIAGSLIIGSVVGKLIGNVLVVLLEVIINMDKKTRHAIFVAVFCAVPLIVTIFFMRDLGNDLVTKEAEKATKMMMELNENETENSELFQEKNLSYTVTLYRDNGAINTYKACNYTKCKNGSYTIELTNGNTIFLTKSNYRNIQIEPTN